MKSSSKVWLWTISAVTTCIIITVILATTGVFNKPSTNQSNDTVLAAVWTKATQTKNALRLGATKHQADKIAADKALLAKVDADKAAADKATSEKAAKAVADKKAAGSLKGCQVLNDTSYDIRLALLTKFGGIMLMPTIHPSKQYTIDAESCVKCEMISNNDNNIIGSVNVLDTTLKVQEIHVDFIMSVVLSPTESLFVQSSSTTKELIAPVRSIRIVRRHRMYHLTQQDAFIPQIAAPHVAPTISLPSLLVIKNSTKDTLFNSLNSTLSIPPNTSYSASSDCEISRTSTQQEADCHIIFQRSGLEVNILNEFYAKIPSIKGFFYTNRYVHKTQEPLTVELFSQAVKINNLTQASLICVESSPFKSTQVSINKTYTCRKMTFELRTDLKKQIVEYIFGDRINHSNERKVRLKLLDDAYIVNFFDGVKWQYITRSGVVLVVADGRSMELTCYRADMV